jgi:hypothetical protein
MTIAKPYQLADDEQTYGPNAGRLIVVTEDGEHELSGPMNEEDAEAFARMITGPADLDAMVERGAIALAAQTPEDARDASAWWPRISDDRRAAYRRVARRVVAAALGLPAALPA